ncbi:MAG: protein phosphatase 2C domain-containing protein [Verrucomicrobiota bacterium]
MADSKRFSSLSLTRPGAKREFVEHKENEDRVLVREFTNEETFSEDPTILVAVADGVSRCADGGAVAEWLLEQVAKDAIFQSGDERTLIKQFHDYAEALRARFMEEFKGRPEVQESGCTFAAALVNGEKGAAYWAGDSPVYLMTQNNGVLKSRTLTIADKDPYSGALTDCFSGVTPFRVKQAGFTVGPGDVVVAVSDGVAYDGEDMASTIQGNGFNQQWMETICQKSFELPYSDDISLAGVQIEE